MSDQKYKPIIRFKEFDDSWKETTYESIGRQISGGNLSYSDLDKFGKYKCVLYGELYTRYDAVIKDIVNRTNKEAATIKKNDILFPQSTTVDALSLISPACMNDDEAQTAGVFIIRPYEGIDGNFVSYYTKGNSNQKYKLSTKAQGLTIVHLYYQSIKEDTLFIPSFKEQKKISSFFLELDDLIKATTEKKERLSNFKSALLLKMFPSADKTSPDIRFKGFKAPWSKYSVGDLLTERNIQSPKSEEYPLMAFIQNIGIAPKGERYDRESLVTDAENKNYKKTEKGDFIYSSNNLETGSIGLNNYGKASISPVYSIFYPTDLSCSSFIGRLMTRKAFIREMVRWRQGVIYGQWRIHESDFAQIKVLAPEVKEQEKIGLLFEKVDNLISLLEKKIEMLMHLKKSLLNKMFC